jgi:hypothetical protein
LQYSSKGGIDERVILIMIPEVISKVFVDFKFFLSGGLPDSPMKPF